MTFCFVFTTVGCSSRKLLKSATDVYLMIEEGGSVGLHWHQLNLVWSGLLGSQAFGASYTLISNSLMWLVKPFFE